MKHDELILERACRNYARQRGWVAMKLEKNGHKGVPDDILLHPDGRYILVEFKKDASQKPRPEQQVWLDKFPSTSYLVGSFDAFKAIIEP